MKDRDPAHGAESPALQDVLAALHDETCRTLLAELSAPMTANDLRDTCDVPKSTLYRKLDLLSQAALVNEHIEIGSDGGRTTRYERDVTDVTISIDDEDTFAVSIDRPPQRVDERLARLWKDMGDEL